MAFNPISYFAGVGTVVAAIGIGFTGGLVITGSGEKYEPPNRVERVASSSSSHSAPSAQKTIPLGATTSTDPQPATPVSTTNSQSATAVSEAARTAPPQPAAPEPARGEPVQAPSEARAADATPRTQPPQVQQSQNQQSAAQQASAKPREQDVDAKKQEADARKQEFDAKRTAERKQAERRRWASRRQQQRQDYRQDNLNDAVTEVRKIDRPGESRGDGFDQGREVVVQQQPQQHDVFEMPRLSFFGD